MSNSYAYFDQRLNPYKVPCKNHHFPMGFPTVRSSILTCKTVPAVGSVILTLVWRQAGRPEVSLKDIEVVS